MSAWILVVMVCWRQCTPIQATQPLPYDKCAALAKSYAESSARAICVPEVQYK